jgi:AraC-like DNA-binding protein
MMARTRYADSHTKPQRRPGVLERREYLTRARELAHRGQDLPQTKLLDLQVGAIRSAARQRENLRRHIRDNLSNEALARQFGVHIRTIEKALARDTHTTLP